MRRFWLILLALATFTAITPVALADSIQVGSSFTVSGTIQPGTLSTDPTFLQVFAFGGTGTFSDIGFQTISTSNIALNQNIIGDTFKITASDGKVITFTVTSVTLGPDNSASGVGTLTDTGYDSNPWATWSEKVDQNGNVSFTFDTVAATPEPANLALLGTGLLALAGILRRRFS